jgi:hypothetical protein
MPLTRLKNEYLEQDGVRFLMEDQDGSTVARRVTMRHCAIMPTVCIFPVPLVLFLRCIVNETLASDAYDAEGPFDEHGRILVTSEALTRVTRSA